MKYLKLAIAACLVLACSDDKENTPGVSWKKLGLDGKTVNEIQVSGSTLYVATTTGLFRKQTTDNADFTLLGFSGKNVEALELPGEGTIIVSIFDKSGAEPPALFRSENAGETWTEIDTDFGGQLTEPVFDLELHPDDHNTLYASGYSVVARSSDHGVEWQPIYGNWGGFSTGVSVVEINPFNDGEIWAGGQGAIENGVLLRSANESDWDSWNDLVDNPTVVKEITFSEGNASEIFVGFEGALLKTTDGGDHWTKVIESEENRFYFGICRRAQDANRVYAGGWLKSPDPQPLILFISDDGGATWQEHELPSEAYGGIFDMQIAKEGNTDVLYVGLDKGGVYRVSIGF